MSEGGLERETIAGDHGCGQNCDENGKGDHLQPHRYLAKLPSTLAMVTKLRNREIASVVCVLGIESQRGRARAR
jgi:hypothetical protein